MIAEKILKYFVGCFFKIVKLSSMEDFKLKNEFIFFILNFIIFCYFFPKIKDFF